MNPSDNHDAYKSMLLGLQRSPGTVVISAHDRNENWDNKKAKGQAGSTSTLNGRDIGGFQATFYLADAEDHAAWDLFQRLIESTTRGPTPVALPVYHPDLARQAYTEVVNAGIGGLKPDGKGGSHVTVKFQEYRPPKPKRARTATSKPGTRTGVTTVSAPDPNAAAKAELASLLDEAREPL